MKTYRTRTGPFAERPYYKDEEIESICSDELRATGLYLDAPGPIRIDRFIEKRFQVVPTYEDLGEGVLGLTVFGSSGVQAIMIARSLDEEGSKTAERRIRTTLAHEGGHGLLHAHLFLPGAEKQPLFGDYANPTAPQILCRDLPDASGSRQPGYDGRWWEYQANRTIGALLMPRLLVQMSLEPLLVTVGLLGTKALGPRHREEAVGLLADTFDVNPVVVRIRLEELYPAADDSQLRL